MSGLQEVPKSKFSRSLNEPIASICSLQSFTNKVEINHFIGGPCQEEELPLGIRHAALKKCNHFCCIFVLSNVEWFVDAASWIYSPSRMCCVVLGGGGCGWTATWSQRLLSLQHSNAVGTPCLASQQLVLSYYMNVLVWYIMIYSILYYWYWIVLYHIVFYTI